MRIDYRRHPLFRLPRKAVKYLMLVWYRIVVLFWKLPKVASIEETIDLVIKENKSVSRYGDGEISIVVDKASYPFQAYDQLLAKRMSEILKSSSEDVLICLPRGFNNLTDLQPDAARMWKAHIAWVYPRLIRHLDLDKQYFNASMTRLYMGIKEPETAGPLFEKIKMIWQDRKVLLVEGEKSRLGVGNDLFADAISVKRILALPQNAFRLYNELLNAVQKFEKGHLVLVALGPTATVLTYDLAQLGYQAIDIGNLDLEYEWYRQKAKVKTKVKGKYTSEVKGGHLVEDVEDATYVNQVVMKVL